MGDLSSENPKSVQNILNEFFSEKLPKTSQENIDLCSIVLVFGGIRRQMMGRTNPKKRPRTDENREKTV